MRRKPGKIKILEGNFRPDRVGVTEKTMDKTEASIPECPSWLDEVGKQTWARVTAAMGKVDLALDVELLSVFCDAYSHLLRCSERLRLEGYTIAIGSGLLKINPSVNVLRELQKTLIEAVKQLGLSNDSRSKMGIVFKQKEPDEFEEFLKTGKACFI
jgi:P27 family predicted phage terminase small subunit